MNQVTLLVIILVVFTYYGGSNVPKVLKDNKELLLGVVGGLVLCSFLGMRLEGFKCQFATQQKIIDGDDCGDGGDVIFENTEDGILLCEKGLVDNWGVSDGQTGACRRAAARAVRGGNGLAQLGNIAAIASRHKIAHADDTQQERIEEARRVTHSLRTGTPVPVDAEERAAWNQRHDPASGPVADRRARIEMYGPDTGPTAADNKAQMYGEGATRG